MCYVGPKVIVSKDTPCGSQRLLCLRICHESPEVILGCSLKQDNLGQPIQYKLQILQQIGQNVNTRTLKEPNPVLWLMGIQCQVLNTTRNLVQHRNFVVVFFNTGTLIFSPGVLLFCCLPLSMTNVKSGCGYGRYSFGIMSRTQKCLSIAPNPSSLCPQESVQRTAKESKVPHYFYPWIKCQGSALWQTWLDPVASFDPRLVHPKQFLIKCHLAHFLVPWENKQRKILIHSFIQQLLTVYYVPDAISAFMKLIVY